MGSACVALMCATTAPVVFIVSSVLFCLRQEAAGRDMAALVLSPSQFPVTFFSQSPILLFFIFLHLAAPHTLSSSVCVQFSVLVLSLFPSLSLSLSLFLFLSL